MKNDRTVRTLIRVSDINSRFYSLIFDLLYSPRKVGLDPKMYAFSPYPPIPIELQVLPRYSPRSSYAYETSATKLSY